VPDAFAFALAPAGDAVVYDAGDGGTWLASTARGAARPRRMPDGATTVRSGAAWAPDGRMVAFARAQRSQLLVVDRAGRTRVRVAFGRDAEATGVDWRPDGARVAVVLTRGGDVGAEVVTLRAD